MHIYNYRAELDMTDKSWENVFSPFIKYISQLWALTEYIPVTSPSSLDYVIKLVYFYLSDALQTFCMNKCTVSFFPHTYWYNTLEILH